MQYAILVLAGLIMTGNVRGEENGVTVRGLSQRLQLTGWQARWQVRGEIVPPIYPLPGGKILAVVKAVGSGALTLMLWDREGHELGRTPLDIAGEVRAGQVFGNRLIVASTGDVAEIDTGTLHKGRVRAFASSSAHAALYQPTPNGLWVVGDSVVSYFDLDGHQSVEKARPLVTIDKPRCPGSSGDAKKPCSSGLQVDQTRALASETGDLLVVEVFKEIYPYSDVPGLFDEVLPSTATVLDTKGAIVVQKALSWMNAKREWFWSKGRGSQDATGIPRWGGLVRTRYDTDGLSLGHPTSARGGDFLLSSRSGKKTVLSRLDRSFNSPWKESLGALSPSVVSPAWASPILFHDKICRQFATIDDEGAGKQERTIEIPELSRELWRNDFTRPRFAIGQSSEGDWLLIAY